MSQSYLKIQQTTTQIVATSDTSPTQMNSQEENKQEKEKRMFASLGIGIAIFILWFALFNVIFNDQGWIISWPLGFTVVIYFAIVFPNTAVIAQPNETYIIANLVRRESAELDQTYPMSGNRVIKAQWVAQAGLNWKYPWEDIIKVIDLNKKLIIDNEQGQSYTFQKTHGEPQKTVIIKWKMNGAAHPAYAISYSRMDKAAIEKVIRFRGEEFFQGHIGSRSTIGFGKDAMTQMRQAYIDRYCKPEILMQDAITMGLIISPPDIYDISNPKEVEDENNFLNELQRDTEMAMKISKMTDGAVSVKEILHTIMLRRSQGAKIDLVELAGVFNPRQQSQQNQQKKKGGK